MAVCGVLACLVVLQPCSWHRTCAPPQVLALREEFQRSLMGMTAKHLIIWGGSHPTKSLLGRGESTKSHQVSLPQLVEGWECTGLLLPLTVCPQLQSSPLGQENKQSCRIMVPRECQHLGQVFTACLFLNIKEQFLNIFLWKKKVKRNFIAFPIKSPKRGS